jgi:hypothetical protein
MVGVVVDLKDTGVRNEPRCRATTGHLAEYPYGWKSGEPIIWHLRSYDD